MASASSRLSLASSSSIALSLATSDTSIPPYLDLYLWNVPWLRPCFRHTSAVGIPASCSLIIPIICAWVKRLFRIRLLLRKVEQTLHYSAGDFGGKVSPQHPSHSIIVANVNLVAIGKVIPYG
eukprot:CAMPEP_0184425340 /NCGR_PEP_ID=MMETSP0738-20130409/130737_1 /TAXON_ID=385413 /ORGANISM="Thalassiosira miniscula, Strain CCMP1093" /LENGTH=122 /DNA_ID=CAMNT_0026788175 /DNA_START=31 /DNA_END=396 /DNA_ORIENTATION=+